MADESKTDAEQNADTIKDVDATESVSRGNVHSEPEEAPELDAPPPLPN